ncbi:zinc finger protein 772-like isoform X2 [Cherax quadricarinatus]|uniref:zinc finger protein 772-like isoform X2 n=1 Tax=Cherax quadricarinatus TaxID=27406 RepID=UPI00387E3529
MPFLGSLKLLADFQTHTFSDLYCRSTGARPKAQCKLASKNLCSHPTPFTSCPPSTDAHQMAPVQATGSHPIQDTYNPYPVRVACKRQLNYPEHEKNDYQHSIPSNIKQLKLDISSSSQDPSNVSGNYQNGAKQLEVNRGTPAQPMYYECGMCHLRTSNSSGITKHMTSHPMGGSVLCVLCGKVAKDVLELNNHVIRHVGVREEIKNRRRPEFQRNEKGKFICPYCKKTYTERDDMIAHTRLHTGEQPYECIFCNKKFHSGKLYANHMKKLHTRED